MYNESGYVSRAVPNSYGWVGRSSWPSTIHCPKCGNNTGEIDDFMADMKDRNYICDKCEWEGKIFDMFLSLGEFKNHHRTKLIDELCP